MDLKEKFKQKFDENYASIYDFMDDFEGNDNPLNLELVANNDLIAYDSYGNEDSTLNRIFFDKELNTHVKFFGTRCSYQGEEWDGYEIVSPKTKTIITYE